ncbi:hypothetical protein F0357_22090 [Rhizobiales bacterium Sp-1]|uniref:IstB-like ATP-binding domain-containing protein n=1 Tax=Segnochrobactrum spirostomi TaxID=2608987 RepID=A0A6A7Y976_9HYPH|nr:hypothetical protein [Segnochrobactrum spirostomi]
MVRELHISRNTARKVLRIGATAFSSEREVQLLPGIDAAHLFFQLVSRRYVRDAMLVTSSWAVGEWGSMFGGPVVATTILDRLLHHSHVITIRGDSYRLREKRCRRLL